MVSMAAAMIAKPVMRIGRRPHLSTSAMAMKVERTFVMPMTIVAHICALCEPNPAISMIFGQKYMTMLMPVSCCTSCSTMPRNTTFLKLAFALKRPKPSCLTFRVSLMFETSVLILSTLVLTFFRTSIASWSLPFAMSHLGEPGTKCTPMRRRIAGTTVTPNMPLHDSIWAKPRSET